MRYYCTKEYNGKNLLGERISIPKYTYLDSCKGYVCYDKKPICLASSQVGIDYFVWADDGNAILRADLQDSILNRSVPQLIEVPVFDEEGNIVKKGKSIKHVRYTVKEADHIRSKYPHLLDDGKAMIFSKNFYNAPIKEIEELANFLKREA